MPIAVRSVYQCGRCGYEWIPRGETKPLRCPSRKCKSRGWDEAAAGPKAAEAELGNLKAKSRGCLCPKIGGKVEHNKHCPFRPRKEK